MDQLEAFCGVFAFALGFASSSSGTLSRNRPPMIPFFFTLLVLRYSPSKHGDESGTQSEVTGETPAQSPSAAGPKESPARSSS